MILALVQNDRVVGLYQPTDEDERIRVTMMFEAAIDVTDRYPLPQIGWFFQDNDLWAQDHTKPVDMRITRLAFRLRLTIPELIAIYTASVTDHICRIILDNLNVAIYIDLSEALTQQALGYFVQAGLLTPERYQEILTTTPSQNELALGG